MGNFTVKFKFDTGWVDVSSITRTKEFFRERYLYKALKPTTDICKFKLQYDQYILSKLLLSDYDIEAEVLKDGGHYFHGIVKPDFKMKSKARVEWVDIQLNDNNYLLDKLIDQNIQSDSIYLCNSDVVTDPSTAIGNKNSLLHLIMFYAGYTTQAWGYTLKAESIQLEYITHLVKKPESKNIAMDDIPYGGTWKQLLQDILFQYGFVYHFDQLGRIQLFNFNDTNISPGSNVFDNTNMVGELYVQKKNPVYDSTEVVWRSVEDYTDVEIFREIYKETADEGNDAVWKAGDWDCNIMLSPDEYFPPTATASSVDEVFYNFKLGSEEDYKTAEDLMAVLNTTKTIEFDGYDNWVVSSVMEYHSDATVVDDFGWVWQSSENISLLYDQTLAGTYGVNGTSVRATYLGTSCGGRARTMVCFPSYRLDYYNWEKTGSHDVAGWVEVDTSHWENSGNGGDMSYEFEPLLLSFNLKIHNTTDENVYLKTLRVRGDLKIKGDIEITKDQYSGTANKTFSYEADYLHNVDDARALANAAYYYYQNSTFTFTLKSRTIYNPGDWVLLTDNNFQNVDNFPVENKRCLVVARKDNEFQEETIYILEEYADYE